VAVIYACSTYQAVVNRGVEQAFMPAVKQAEKPASAAKVVFGDQCPMTKL
jgi:hypothetical protein